MLTSSRLREVLRYRPDRGDFVWLVDKSPTARAGYIAAPSPAPTGYMMIGVDGTKYLAHRLAWLYMTGEWPEFEIDHINRSRADNRWDNLRKADRREQSGNIALPSHNTSGRKGVCWDKSRGKWIVHIKIDGRQKFLGRYGDIDAASAVYDAAAVEHFGRFAYTNMDMAA